MGIGARSLKGAPYTLHIYDYRTQETGTDRLFFIVRFCQRHSACFIIDLWRLNYVESHTWDPVAQTTVRRGLGHLWPHFFGSVDANVSQAFSMEHQFNSHFLQDPQNMISDVCEHIFYFSWFHLQPQTLLQLGQLLEFKWGET